MTDAEMDTFLRAIAAEESGGRRDPYNVRGQKMGGDSMHAGTRAIGKYQLMPSTYSWMAGRVGVSPRDRSPAAQEKVAREYARYLYHHKNSGGDFERMARGWLGGQGVMDDERPTRDKAFKHVDTFKYGERVNRRFQEWLPRHASQRGNRPPAAAPDRRNNGVFDPGDRGEDVKRVQRMLGVTPDGIYGPQTAAAARDFQRRNRLTADGIVGVDTMRALRERKPGVGASIRNLAAPRAARPSQASAAAVQGRESGGGLPLQRGLAQDATRVAGRGDLTLREADPAAHRIHYSPMMTDTLASLAGGPIGAAYIRGNRRPDVGPGFQELAHFDSEASGGRGQVVYRDVPGGPARALAERRATTRHEAGHAIDFRGAQPEMVRRANEQFPAYQKQHGLFGDYGATNPTEHFAVTLPRAMDYLDMLDRQMRNPRNVYLPQELDVPVERRNLALAPEVGYRMISPTDMDEIWPGAGAVSEELLKQPVYQNHPYNQVRRPMPQDATRIAPPPPTVGVGRRIRDLLRFGS